MLVSAAEMLTAQKPRLLFFMFKEMESLRCKIHNKQVKCSDLTFTSLYGTFLQNDLMVDGTLAKQ